MEITSAVYNALVVHCERYNTLKLSPFHRWYICSAINCLHQTEPTWPHITQSFVTHVICISNVMSWCSLPWHKCCSLWSL